jgi:hypothetical protein
MLGIALQDKYEFKRQAEPLCRKVEAATSQLGQDVQMAVGRVLREHGLAGTFHTAVEMKYNMDEAERPQGTWIFSTQSLECERRRLALPSLKFPGFED